MSNFQKLFGDLDPDLQEIVENALIQAIQKPGDIHFFTVEGAQKYAVVKSHYIWDHFSDMYPDHENMFICLATPDAIDELYNEYLSMARFFTKLKMIELRKSISVVFKGFNPA